MLPDRVSNPGPLTYESGALPIALRGPANIRMLQTSVNNDIYSIRNIILYITKLRDNFPCFSIETNSQIRF